MNTQREIPIEDEDDTLPVSEYEINELERKQNKERRYYLSKTDSKGRGGGGNSCKYNNNLEKNKNILYNSILIY